MDGTRCAVGIQYDNENGGGLAQSVYTIDIETGQKYHYTNESQDGNAYYVATALVPDTMTVYASNWINNNLNAYNIITEQETFIGTLSRNLNGLDYNPFDGLFYGHTYVINTPFYTLNLTSLEITQIGNSDYDLCRTVQVSKNGNYLYYTGNPRRLIRAPINNVSPATEEIIIPSSVISPLGLPDSSDWYNDDPNDERLIICFFRSPPPCYVFNLSESNPQPELLFTASDGRTIAGFEVLPGEYDNCDIITTPLPEPSGCPCYNNLDLSLKYCVSSCCDVGTLIQTTIDGVAVQYGLRGDDKSCFVSNDGVISTDVSLSDAIYYTCEAELLPVINNNITCTVSEANGHSIFATIKSFLKYATATGSDISLALVISYVVFIFVVLIAVIVPIYMGAREIIALYSNRTSKHDSQYSQVLNADTHSDVSTQSDANI